METEYTINELLQQIDSVWGDYDDFKTGGYDYYTFVILQDLLDIQSDIDNPDECIEELADIAINTLRLLHELGHDPTREINNRLEEHNERDPQQLIEQMQSRYKTEGNPLTK